MKGKGFDIRRWKEGFCEVSYRGRLPSIPVRVGRVTLGYGYPVAIQSMTLSDAIDVERSVEETIELCEKGADVVRITVPSVASALALKEIKEKLGKKGYDIPIVADIHYTPNAALIAAQFVEKVRINPGNYADKKKLQLREYTEGEYMAEVERIRERFLPLVRKCKEYGRALRIGVNHGSLSDRIMSVYGDTPEGMVASAMEYVDICEEEGFHNIVISMKASNPIIMVQAYRLLAITMIKRGRCYPVHLGLTEAGNGIEGRIKSVAAISSLLFQGIGDTIRISLTEPPANEIPVCQALLKTVESAGIDAETILDKGSIEGVGNYSKFPDDNMIPGFITIGQNVPPYPDAVYLPETSEVFMLKGDIKGKFVRNFIEIDGMLFSTIIWDGNLSPNTLIAEYNVGDGMAFKKIRNWLYSHSNSGYYVVIAPECGGGLSHEETAIQIGTQIGPLILDGLIRGVWLRGTDIFLNGIMQDLLQVLRLRMSKTEIIACPGCGRTLFELEPVTNKVKEAVGHIPGLKVAVMGCIVNGLGEIADADYGYIGSGPGKVSIFRGKEAVFKNVPEQEAIPRLIELIKADGRWIEKVPSL